MSQSSRRSARQARRAGILATLCSTLLVVCADAQVRRAPTAPTGATPRAGSWEVSGGIVYGRGYDGGEAPAELTRNTTSGPPEFTLFVSESRVEPAWAIEGRLAYYLASRFAVEGAVRYGRPVYSVALSGDVEGAPDLTAEETLNQYVFAGSALWHFSTPPSSRAGVVPFVYGGAGYIRDLHEGRELVETGIEYHAGAGLKYWFGGGRRRVGLRGDAGVSIRDGGFDPEEKVRSVLVAGASLVYLF